MTMTYIDRTLSYVQTALIVLKLLGMFDSSWWVVMLPSIIWAVLGMLVIMSNATDAEIEKIEETER